VFPCGRADCRTERRIDTTKILFAFPNFANAPKKRWQIPCITSRITPSVALWYRNWTVVCISDENRYSVRPTTASTAVYRPHASRLTPFPDSYPAAAGCSAARQCLLARPTSVTPLCNSDMAKNVSFSCYITGRKVKGKVRPACTTACNWRPTAGVRSKLLRAAG
jgi:hypothetical protein